MERLGQVEEARGNYATAAKHYRDAFHFLEGKPGYDPQIREWLKRQALLMEAKASAPSGKNSDA